MAFTGNPLSKITCAFTVATMLLISNARAEQLDAASCQQGLESFPFLKPLVGELKKDTLWVEAGRLEGAYVYALGATIVRSTSAIPPNPTEETWSLLGNLWRNDAAVVKVGSGTFSLVPLSDPPGPKPGTPGKGWGSLWAELTTAEESQLLSKCSIDDCKIKLAGEERQKVVAGAPSERAAAYWNALLGRLERYRTKGEVQRYEEPGFLRLESIAISDKIPDALTGRTFSVAVDRTAFGFETLNAQPGRHKPVNAVYGRTCSTGSANSSPHFMRCQDLVVYNNHYFDFWGRTAFFFPWCGRVLVVLYESADVDQLKGGKTAQVLKQMLFGNEIRKMLKQVLEARLQRLHMLGF